MSSAPIVIIGMNAAGAGVATRLRRDNEHVPIVCLESNSYVSWSTCSMPYTLTNETQLSALTVVDSAVLKNNFKLDLRLRSEVVEVTETDVLVKNLEDNSTYRLPFSKLVIATGSSPRGDAAPSPLVHKIRRQEDIAAVKQLVDSGKKNILVVGAGFIGLEMTESLTEMGHSVTIATREEALSHLDREVVKPLNAEFKVRGVKTIFNADVQLSSMITENNSVKVIINDQSHVFDLVILAIGVQPSTSFLPSKMLVRGGYVNVDRTFKVQGYDNIYALGDCALYYNKITKEMAPLPLAGPAASAARIVAQNLLGANVKHPGVKGSSVVRFHDYVIASFGLSSKALTSKNIEHKYLWALAPSHIAAVKGGAPIFVKVCFNKEGEVLGASAHSYAPGANMAYVGEACCRYVDVINASSNLDELETFESCYSPHYGAPRTVVNFIAMAANNWRSGREDFILPTQLSDEVIIDVRPPQDYEEAHPKGAINIPMGKLRSALPELDKSKKYVVSCNIGRSSHNAYCLMKNEGFDVKNLSGGIKIYSRIQK